MPRYTQTVPCWSISLEINGIGLLHNSFLAINSIENSIIQHRKKLVTKLLDYFSVRGGDKNRALVNRISDFSLNFYFLMHVVIIVHKNSQLKQKRCQNDEWLWRYGSSKIVINLIQREIIS